MFNLFRKQSWVQEQVPLARGEYEGLRITVEAVPCERDPASGRRRFPYADFGSDLRGELAALDDYDNATRVLKSGRKLTQSVQIREFERMTVTLEGDPGESARAFSSNLSDALIKAFEGIHLSPQGG